MLRLAFCKAVCQVVHPLCVDCNICVVSLGWLCWLPPIHALGLLLSGVYCPKFFHHFFLSAGWKINPLMLHDINKFQAITLLPQESAVLSSGPIEFLDNLQSCLMPPYTVFLYAVNLAFNWVHCHDLNRRYAKWSIKHASLGSWSMVVSHANCGGIMLACYYICFRNAGHDGVMDVPCIPWCLGHVVNAAKKSDGKGWWLPLEAPPDLFGLHMHAPLVVDGLLRCEGLWDVHNPSLDILRPCIFKATGWACGGLLVVQFLHAFDVPLALFAPILTGKASRRPLGLIVWCILMWVVSTLLHTIWSSGDKGGLNRWGPEGHLGSGRASWHFQMVVRARGRMARRSSTVVGRNCQAAWQFWVVI